jgi:hypothetical protein
MVLRRRLEGYMEDLRNRSVMLGPLYSYMNKTYIVPIAVILWWGWHCSGNSTDGLPFARAGALVTTLSVMFESWKFGQYRTGA